MKLITAPSELPAIDNESVVLFLAGGCNVPWREELVSHMFDLDKLLILDPTVDDWKSLGEEDIDNEQWVKQTDWEHNGLIRSDIRVFHFHPPSMCPISLLELGCFKVGGDKVTIVHADSGYEKASYVKHIARRYGLLEAETIKEIAELIKIKYYELSN